MFKIFIWFALGEEMVRCQHHRLPYWKLDFQLGALFPRVLKTLGDGTRLEGWVAGGGSLEVTSCLPGSKEEFPPHRPTVMTSFQAFRAK